MTRHDYLPFGEELGAGVGGRTISQGYRQFDGNRKRWAELERDDETGLDYAQSRCYASKQARFTSPDPYNIILEKEKGQDEKERRKFFLGYVSQPQNWNKYAYTLNNPLKYSDPDGRRQVNAEDQRRIDILNREALAAREAGNTNRAEAFEEAINHRRHLYASTT